MRALIFLSISLVPAAGVALAQHGNETPVYAEDFDTGVADGWILSRGWDIAPLDEGYALHAVGEGHTHCWYPEFWADSRVRCRIRLDGDAMHISYRESDQGRYFLRIDQHQTQLNKQIAQDEFLNGLAVGPGMSYEQWHTVEIDGVGPILEVSIDGEVVLEFDDDDPLPSGGISFEAFAGELWIDDVEILIPESSAPAPGPAWERMGGPLGGLGYDVRMRPGAPDHMYVTDAFAGCFRSDDLGATWFPANSGIPATKGLSGDAIPVFCLTIDQHDPNIVWCGTQYKRGIYKSIDGGARWFQRDGGVEYVNGITFRGFTVDPSEPGANTVYAAAELSSWAWREDKTPTNGQEFDLTKGVIYKTIDGGENWEPIWDGDNLVRYIWIDPRDTKVIYASTGIFDREAANSDAQKHTPGGVGVIKSTNGGESWNEINEGIGNLYVGTLFMHPTNPDVLLAGAGNNIYAQGSGVYLTLNGGGEWALVLDTQLDPVTAVEISAADPLIAYAGTSHEIFRSDDGGHTWNVVSGSAQGWGAEGIRAGFPIDFEIDPETPYRIFANNYGGGNFLSVDGGASWSDASKGYTGAQIRDIAVDPAAPGQVLAAGRSGLFLSANGGADWIGRNYDNQYVLEWHTVAIDPSNSNHILSANNYTRVVLESHNRGRTWRPASAQPGSKMSFSVIRFAPGDVKTVFAGTAAYITASTFDPKLSAAGLYVSYDQGASFAPSNNTLSADAAVTDISIAPNDSKLIYASTFNHGVLASTDGGTNWTESNQGLPVTSANCVAIHPTTPGVVFAGLTSAGLYRKPAHGAVWSYAGLGMNPQAGVSSIIFDPTDAQVMYAADLFTGVYQSIDGGEGWRLMSDGLRMHEVRRLGISSDGMHLYAATEGEGVYRLDLNGQPPADAAWPADEVDDEIVGDDETPNDGDGPSPEDEPGPEGEPGPGDEPGLDEEPELEEEPPGGENVIGSEPAGVCGTTFGTNVTLLLAYLGFFGTCKVRRRACPRPL